MTTLDIINTISGVITAGSLSVALASYFYNKNRNKVLMVVDQVSFFREKIIPESDKLVLVAREQNPEYVFTNQIKILVFQSKDIREKYVDEIKNQFELIKNQKATVQQIIILNLLEELSLKIIYTKTFNHKALNSIVPAFIQLVENNVIILISQREVITGNNIYSGTVELYKKWVDRVERKSPEERLKEL